MWRKASIATIVALAFTLLAAADAKDDLAQMQGSWTMASGERGGAPLPDAMVKSGTRIVKDNETTVTVGGMVILKARFAIDATKNPKTIDYTITADGPNKGMKQLGIYELDGDTLKFCYAPIGAERPTAFATKPADGLTLSVWNRAK